MTTPKSRRLRRIFVAASAATLSLVSLAACSTTPSTESTANSITVWTGLPFDTFQKPNAANFARCEKSTGIKAKLEDFPAADLPGKAIQAGTSGDLPDLLYLDATNLSQVASAGLLTKLPDHDISAKGYAPSAVTMGTWKNNLYGIAPGVNTIAVFYNKEMFTAAGVAVPKSFAELRSAAKKLTTPDVMGIALAADTGTGPYEFLPYLLGAGGDPSKLTSPAATKALQLWQDFITDGSTSKSAVNWGWDSQDYFRHQKAAMVISGAWLFSEKNGFEPGVFPVPTVDGKGTPRAPLGAELWTIPVTNSAHEKAAAKVLSCLTSYKNSLTMAAESGRPPGNIAVGAAFAKQFPTQKPLIDLIANGYIQDTDKIGKQYQQLSLAIQDSLANNTAPADALKKAAKQ